MPTDKGSKKPNPARKRVSRLSATPATAISVGDHIRLPASSANEILRYDPQRASTGRMHEAVQGIVCSIREVATGHLLDLAAGDLRQYVFEVIHDQCFDRRFASKTNCEGSKGADRIRDNALWQSLRGELRARAERRQLANEASAGLAEPLGSVLDGWRIVKIRAAELENLTEPAP